MKLYLHIYVDYRETIHTWEDVEHWHHFGRGPAAVNRILDAPESIHARGLALRVKVLGSIRTFGRQSLGE